MGTSTTDTSATVIYSEFYEDEYDVALSYQASLIAQAVSSKVVNVAAGETTYVYSSDRNAYPDNETVDDLTYRYLGIPFGNSVTAPGIGIGSYTGTGVYGASNPNTLTFDFPPELLFIAQASADASRSGYFIRGAARGIVNWCGGEVSNSVVELTWDGNSVSWYDDSDASHQLNVSGGLYRYVAIG